MKREQASMHGVISKKAKGWIPWFLKRPTESAQCPILLLDKLLEEAKGSNAFA